MRTLSPIIICHGSIGRATSQGSITAADSRGVCWQHGCSAGRSRTPCASVVDSHWTFSVYRFVKRLLFLKTGTSTGLVYTVHTSDRRARRCEPRPVRKVATRSTYWSCHFQRIVWTMSVRSSILYTTVRLKTSTNYVKRKRKWIVQCLMFINPRPDGTL